MKRQEFFSTTVERVAREMHAVVEPADPARYPGWEASPEDEKNFYRSCAVSGLRLEHRLSLSLSKSETARMMAEETYEGEGDDAEFASLDASNALLLQEAIDLLGTEAGSTLYGRSLAYLED